MKKEFIAKIVSAKTQKTVTVKVTRKFRHPLYRKVIVRHRSFKAHNEKMELVVGDTVRIQETRPISKDKHFIVVEKIDNNKLKVKSQNSKVKSTTQK